MKHENYKITIMGASGVGKTTFLASYFHLASRLQRGTYPVSFKKNIFDKKIDNITRMAPDCTISEKTTERIDIVFGLDSLGMTIECTDIPGEFAQDMALWDERKILSDLKHADALLFFISTEDVMFGQDKIVEDNLVFATAISHLRKKGKAVPIWFLFTKGNKVLDVSLEELQSRLPALLKTARDTKHPVRAWKIDSVSEQMSLIASDQSQSKDIIDPMESLFEEMKNSAVLFRKKVRFRVSLFILLAVSFSLLGGWGFSLLGLKTERAVADGRMERIGIAIAQGTQIGKNLAQAVTADFDTPKTAPLPILETTPVEFDTGVLERKKGASLVMRERGAPSFKE